MKMKINHIAIFALLFVNQIFAQDVTTVTANSYDISDNLDLKAVASIFGESRDLEDFERRLNDPNVQISNLDLNNDNRVDYLRVIEVTENNTHLIILQSVLAVNTFQDVATIEVERDRYNNVQVQVVGDVYMYGPNYIYEPVYVSRPFIFDVFWVSSYRPYYSPWYWGYYPTYYSYWNPYPVYRYRNNIHVHINNRNTYNYASTRRSSRAVTLHNSRRANAYERQHPNNSFTSRTSLNNRYALEQSRSTYSTRNNTTRSSRSTYTNSSRPTSTTRTTTSNTVRSSNINRSSVRNTNTNSSRSSSSPARSSSTSRSNNNSSRTSGQNTRNSSSTRVTTPTSTRTSTPSTTRSSSGSSTRTSSPSRSSSNSSSAPTRTSSSSSSRNSRG